MVRPRGCVRLNCALSLPRPCRLWSSRSLFRKSTVPPSGTTTTRGTYTHDLLQGPQYTARPQAAAGCFSRRNGRRATVRPADVPDRRRRHHGALPAVRDRLSADAARQGRRGRAAGRHRGGDLGAGAAAAQVAVVSLRYGFHHGEESMRITIAVSLALAAAAAGAQTLQVPAKSLPVPDTVSPQMQKLIGAPLNPSHNQIPATPEEWKKQIGGVEAATVKGLPALREALKVTVEPTVLDGVKAYVVTPQNISPQNRNRLLVHVHGGCFASF